MKLFLVYVYESIKGRGKENESNGLLDKLLKKYFDIFEWTYQGCYQLGRWVIPLT